MWILRRAWETDRALCLFTVAFWLTWAVCFESRVDPPDGVGYYAWAQSLVTDGDLSLDDEFRGWRMWQPYRRLTEMGYTLNVFAVGTSLLWLPFAAAAHLLSLFFNLFNAGLRVDGFGYQYLYSVNLATAIYGFFALLLGYRAAVLVSSRAVAISAVIAVATLSPFWNYLFFQGTFSHVPDAFTVALFIYLFLRTEIESHQHARRRHGSLWLLLGVAAGLAVLTRWQNIVLPVLIGSRLVFAIILAVLRRVSRRFSRFALWEERPARSLLIFALGSLSALLPQLIIWWLQFGTPIAVPQGEDFFDWSRPRFLTLLFSPSHGLYTWTPLLFLATVPGLALLLARFRSVGVFLLVCFLFQIYINSVVHDVSAGVSFGARRFVGYSALYVLGLAAFISRVPRWLSVLVVGAVSLWTIPLWLAYQSEALDQARLLSINQLLHAMGLTVAHVPALLEHMRIENLQRLTKPDWYVAILVLVLFVVVFTLARLSMSRPRLKRSAIVVSFASVLCLDLIVALGALRSRPAPAPARYHGRAAMIDFGWYANSRFDWDPFMPDLYEATSLPDLRGGLRHWGKIPFHIRKPAGHKQTLPSVATNCDMEEPFIAIDLRRRATNAIHLAFSAINVLKPYAAVAVIDIVYADGSVLSKIPRANVDAWDFFASVPRQRVVYQSQAGSVTGYSIALDPERIPARLIVRKSPIGSASSSCVALFAVTQEHAIGPGETTGNSASYRYSPVDLGAAANANHARDPFSVYAIANHFPDLRPGVLHFAKTPFLILDRDRTPTGGSTLTSAYVPGFRQRIPLEPVRSTALSLLLDGAVVPNLQYKVAEIVIEYQTGSEQTAVLYAQRDVWNYFDYPPAGKTAWRGPIPQDLSYYSMALDPARIPAYLWLKAISNAAIYPVQTGVAIFAITQTR
ncbi:MAG: hypothetical protein JXA30_18215 [Deltaproteobacteria bacterium]|nr:hypothetical protein [Deltaproteobacteria bacterium]